MSIGKFYNSFCSYFFEDCVVNRVAIFSNVLSIPLQSGAGYSFI